MAKNKADNASAEKRKEIGPFPIFDPADYSKLGARNLQVATRAARAYFNGAAQFNQEVMSFMTDRTRKDIETASHCMTAKTSEDAFHAQAQFVEQAIRDYADEASKLLHMAADLAHDTLAPVEKRTEEMLHTLDERADQAERSAAAE